MSEETTGSQPLTRDDIPELVRAVAEALSRKDPAAAKDQERPEDSSSDSGSGRLDHIPIIGEKVPHPKSNTLTDPPKEGETSSGLCIGAGLPPVPRKLVIRIQAGEYVDMAELLPDRLGVNASPTGEKGDKQTSKPKRRQVTNILEWVQCFSIYTAVLTMKDPDRIQDLLGYQALIVEACMEYECDQWLGYDRCFRQNAAASPGTVWAKIESTLWNKAFSGKARKERCKFCFSLTHKSEDCDWAPTQPSAEATKPAAAMYKPPPRPRSGKICYAWNHDPAAACAYPDCSYQHICLYCARDLQATFKDHKAIFCRRRKGAPTGGQGPHLGQPNYQGQAQRATYRYQPY